MSQTVFANVQVGTAAPLQKDGSNHQHTPNLGTAGGMDVTVSFDPVTVVNMTVLRTAILSALKLIEGSGKLAKG